MPIKNFLKIFTSKFSMVYAILLYLIVILLIIASVSVFAIIPVYRFLDEKGVLDMLGELLTRFVINGYSTDVVQLASECFANIRNALSYRTDLFFLSVFYIVLVLGVLFRLTVGMLELPLLKKLQGAMSDNASYGFVGLFISTFVDSLLYSIVKILVKFAADIAVYALVFVISSALFNTAAAIMVPFVGCFILVMYYAFKGGLTACWGAGIAVDGKSIFGALKYSVKTFFSDFLRFYGTYVVLLFLLLGINFFLARYTFGASIVISVPISLFLVYVFNMTYYYTKRGYRYYVGGDIAGGEEVKR